MADQGFPSQITTTTVTSSSTTVQTNIRFDPTYIRTVPGILKCAQIVLNLLVFLCVSFSMYASVGRLSFMSFICGLGFWFTGIMLGLYVFHVVEKFFKVPWLKIELGFCAVWTVFLLIGSSLCTAYMGVAAIFGFVAFFGYCNMIAYGYDAFLKFKSIQNGEIAQGERHVSKTESSVASPAAY